MIATTSLRGKILPGEPSEPKNLQLHSGEGKSFQIALNKRTHHADNLQRPDPDSIDGLEQEALGEPIVATTPSEDLLVSVKTETPTIGHRSGIPCSGRETQIQVSPVELPRGRNAHAINFRTNSTGSKSGNPLPTERDSQSSLSFELTNAAPGPNLHGGVAPIPVLTEFALRLPAITVSGSDGGLATGLNLLPHALIPVHIPEMISSIAISLNSEKAGEFTIRICQRRDELDVMIYFKDAEFLDKFQGKRDLLMAALRNENLPVAALNFYDMGRLPLTIFPARKAVRSGLTLSSAETMVSTEVNLTSDTADTSEIVRTITDFVDSEIGEDS